MACTDTQTEPVQAVTLAPQLVSFPTSTTISATVRPSSSSGVTETSRQPSEGPDGSQPLLPSPLLTLAAISNAPWADPLARLTNACLLAALHEFTVAVEGRATVEVPRLLAHIQGLDFELSGVPAPLSVSGGTLRDDEMKGDHGADNWANDWGAQNSHAGEQGADADVEYMGAAQAPWASPSTVAAAAKVGLFAADISSPKFYAALAAGLITPTEPPLSSTPAPTEKLVVVTTESPPALVPRKEVRSKKKTGGAFYRHEKRLRRKSPSVSPPADSVSLPLPSSRPESRTSPAPETSGRLRRAAAVAADQRLVKQSSQARRRFSFWS